MKLREFMNMEDFRAGFKHGQGMPLLRGPSPIMGPPGHQPNNIICSFLSLNSKEILPNAMQTPKYNSPNLLAASLLE